MKLHEMIFPKSKIEVKKTNLSLAGAVEWPHSVRTIGATLGTIIINQTTLVNIWK